MVCDGCDDVNNWIVGDVDFVMVLIGFGVKMVKVDGVVFCSEIKVFYEVF